MRHSDEWKLAFVAAILISGDEAAVLLERGAASLSANPEYLGIVNLLRDSAAGTGSARQFEDWNVI